MKIVASATEATKVPEAVDEGAFSHREREPYLSETIAFLGFSFDYRSYLQSISDSPFLVIASFFRKSPLWPFVLRHKQLFGCFLPDVLPSWFFCTVEVSQDISVAKALVIMFYSVFVKDGYP
ncbi:hypothetical protein ALC57_01299 [Trachymyrmex cornetzi]|uniref:Uncharacterized protein n=1 Tax=Trachymyrmex cornetzi TaxID=471704 RepID=A0A195EMQ7_9HYME|nr:hypothetical protein ALC57_01299 [Trachymyrmex cornetzi]